MSGTARPLELAATIVPARTIDGRFEVLMVRRNEELSFGGMWTFPGGRIDPEDGPIPDLADEAEQDWLDLALVGTASVAARRELREEVDLDAPAARLRLLSHWIPPLKGPPRRFATWFFLSDDIDGTITVDTTENSEARWVEPAAAMRAHADGEFPVATPTFVTLDDLQRGGSYEGVLDQLGRTGPNIHHTRAHVTEAGERVLFWQPDAAYESGDIAAAGARNRVVLGADGITSARERSMDGG